MTPPESLARGVRVIDGVGKAMMDSVVTRPPERAFLSCSATAVAQNELKHQRGLVCLMREVPVIPARDKEHPGPEGDCKQNPCSSTYTREDHQKWEQVDGKERDRRSQIDPTMRQAFGIDDKPSGLFGRFAPPSAPLAVLK